MSSSSSRASKEELKALLLSNPHTAQPSTAAGNAKRVVALPAGVRQNSNSGTLSSAISTITHDMSNLLTTATSASSASSSSTAVATSSRLSRPPLYLDRNRATPVTAGSSTYPKKPSSHQPKLNKNGCLPGCQTFPRCSCRLKSSLKEKLRAKFDLAMFGAMTKESELLNGVRLLADLVEDGKVGLGECVERKVMERLTGMLSVSSLQAAALETVGVLLYVWLRVTKANTKKGKGGNNAASAGAAAQSNSTALVPHSHAAPHKHEGPGTSCSVCPSCRSLAASSSGALPASTSLPPMSLDDWLCTPAATALISATLPLLRPLSTRHMASYVLLHYCDGSKAATTFINTPHAIPTLLDVYSSLTDTKDTSMLLELSSIITGVGTQHTQRQAASHNRVEAQPTRSPLTTQHFSRLCSHRCVSSRRRRRCLV